MKIIIIPIILDCIVGLWILIKEIKEKLDKL